MSAADTNIPAGSGLTADLGLELRVAGRQPSLLVSAVTLKLAVNQDPLTPEHLQVFPDPQGDKLAVVLISPESGLSHAPTVIINRRGRVLAATGDSTSLDAFHAPVWSPDGRALAYANFADDLAIWHPGHPVITLPSSRLGNVGECQWNQDGSAVLCSTLGEPDNRWAIANSSGLFTSIPDNRIPLLWFDNPTNKH